MQLPVLPRVEAIVSQVDVICASIGSSGQLHPWRTRLRTIAKNCSCNQPTPVESE